MGLVMFPLLLQLFQHIRDVKHDISDVQRNAALPLSTTIWGRSKA